MRDLNPATVPEVVVDDVEAALGRLAAGESVVLVLEPGSPPIGEVRQGPGRLAVIVGSLSDPAVRDAAAAMDAELFRGG